jgi:penicillin-binding protein 1C
VKKMRSLAGTLWAALRGGMAQRRRQLAVSALVMIAAAGAWVRGGPLPPGLLDAAEQPSTLVVDRQGRALYEALSVDGTRAMPMTADRIPPVLEAATTAAEDRRFYSHVGVDPIAVARALKANLAAGAVVEGGSTITQQVAKLLLDRRTPGERRGVLRKVEEALVALRLEHRRGKRDILAMYFNLASYGNQISGVERASRAYFGVSASMLTPAQAAFLAGLPQRPSAFNPYRRMDAALARQRVVLARMVATKTLSAEQAHEAREERIGLTRERTPFTAPHFVRMVLTSAGVARPARIETTLDGDLQADVSGIIRSHRDLLLQHGASNAAVVVLDNTTGEWLAWEGSGDYFDRDKAGTINGPTMPRQPGSALKPFTYALAFDRGYTPASVLPDVPSSFPTSEPGVVYTPRNYDGRYRGPLLARFALAGSENVPAVALAAEMGVPDLMRLLSRAGLTTFDRTAAHYGLGLTLGNAEVRLDELVAAYAALARGGEWIEPTFLPRDRTTATVRRLVSSRAAFWVTDILSDGEAREFAFGRGGNLELPFAVAVKTGTSQAYHDNWTIGYSRQVTVGVWVGNFDRTPLRNSSGVTGAAPIFHAVMLAAQRRIGGPSWPEAAEAIVAQPRDTTRAEVCALSGMAANAWCPLRRREWVAAGAAPLPCSWHHHAGEGLLTFWPAEYHAWARQQGLTAPALVSDAAPARRELSGTGVHERKRTELEIVSPPEDATYLIDPTLRREFQTLPLRASSTSGGLVEWTVSGRAVGSSRSGAAVDWPLTPGRHRIVAKDDGGREAEVTVTVK